MTSSLLVILFMVMPLQKDTNQKYLDYLSSALTNHNGVEMKIKWSQVDGENVWSEVGVIELLGNNKYFLSTNEQSIKVDNDLIITYYKTDESKIIYDTMIDGSYDIFDFLSGNFSGFTINNSSANRETIQLDYTLNELYISGKIWIKQKTFKPVKFTIGQNPNRPEQYIEVEITDYQPILGNSQFDLFAPKAKEIIDLRE
ncbi:MAG TPA: hypothetical protein EYM74_04225 [Candidatus Marinimicrobia bacterium]|nr:hypothetical protein [Candidatus Neomarinimicrobiota bacterium]